MRGSGSYQLRSNKLRLMDVIALADLALCLLMGSLCMKNQ